MVTDLWIAVKSFAFFVAFVVYMPFSIATDKSACGREILKMFLTFVMYTVLVPLDLTAIIFFPAMLMVKGFETPYRLLLDMFGIIPSEQRRMEDTRFKIPVYDTEIFYGQKIFKSLDCKRIAYIGSKAFEKIAMYGCGFYLLCCLVQLNVSSRIALKLLYIVLPMIVITSLSFFFRQGAQNTLSRFSICGGQSYYKFYQTMKAATDRLTDQCYMNSDLGNEIFQISVFTDSECPWMEKFRVDQLRIAANFLPGVGPATSLIFNNFRLTFRQQYLGLARTILSIVQFVACASAILTAFYIEDRTARAWATWVLDIAYFCCTLVTYYDEASDFCAKDDK